MMLDVFLTLLVTYEFVLSEIVASPIFVIGFIYVPELKILCLKYASLWSFFVNWFHLSSIQKKKVI